MNRNPFLSQAAQQALTFQKCKSIADGAGGLPPPNRMLSSTAKNY